MKKYKNLSFINLTELVSKCAKNSRANRVEIFEAFARHKDGELHSGIYLIPGLLLGRMRDWSLPSFLVKYNEYDCWLPFLKALTSPVDSTIGRMRQKECYEICKCVFQNIRIFLIYSLVKENLYFLSYRYSSPPSLDAYISDLVSGIYYPSSTSTKV